MAQRRGRPRSSIEAGILQVVSADEKKAEDIVAQKINPNTPSIMAFEAASLLHAIEGGTHHLAIESTPIFRKINQYARENGPHGEWCSARAFLNEFVKKHAPNFDWHEDARQGDVEDGIRKLQEQQFVQEHADDERWAMSWAIKYYTPSAPDAVLLCNLAWDYGRPAGKQRRRGE